MQTRNVLLALAAATSAAAASALLAGCKTTDCGSGTTEQDGTCVPANVAYGNEMCGPFTELHGGQCEPVYPPTVCGPGTLPTTGNDGVATCLPDGSSGCGVPLACPAPADGKQTICGQLYDFETGATFSAAGATGAQCTTTTTTGPCSLGIKAYDAVAFAMSQSIDPLAVGSTYVDDCGRYRLSEISLPGANPFILVAVDDAEAAMKGPTGVTNATGVAAGVAANTATKNLEAFIVKPSTTASWGATPALSAGIYAAVYRGHSTGTDPAVGVTLTIAPMNMPTNQAPDANRDFYFQSGSTNRTTLDGAANATTTNGTALLTGATLTELYSGAGAGLPSTDCIWELHAGAAVPYSIFIQIFRPTNAPGHTCPL